MFLTPRSFVPTIRVPKFLHFRSFVLGAVVAVVFVGVSPREAEAFDIAGIAGSISRLVKIKKNLDGDVKNLTADAKLLFSDKDKLFQIKEQLLRLATETKSQIDSIQTLVGEVEGHIKKTQADIAQTAKHVNEIDEVRKKLEGKK